MWTVVDLEDDIAWRYIGLYGVRLDTSKTTGKIPLDLPPLSRLSVPHLPYQALSETPPSSSP